MTEPVEGVDFVIIDSEERKMDYPTQLFDRDAWIVEHNDDVRVRPWERERPASEKTLEEF